MAMSSAMIAETTMGQSVSSSWWLLPDPTVTVSEPHQRCFLGGGLHRQLTAHGVALY